MEKRTSLVNDNVVITLDNIEKLSKILALSILKNFKKYAFGGSSKIERLHKQLQYDICYHKQTDIYSDAYDLVQEANVYLMQFLDKRLGDDCVFIKQSVKKPQITNIRNGCFKTLARYLRSELKNNDREDEEPIYFIEAKDLFNKEPEDYTRVNQMIEKLVTNELESQILEYYYNGVEPNLIAEILDISVDKVYKRRRKFKDRYKMYFM